MLVLHGFWSNSGGMRLWAEDSDLLVKSPSQALRSARPHPFAAPADLIAGIHPGKPATAVLLLPSLRSAPLDSPELIRLAPRPAARTDPMLLAWTVPVVDLDPTAALAAFDQPAPDVRYGASVDYLAELAVFARELVERGRVLPQLRRDTHGAAACWRPVLQGRDVVAMTSLVSAMPPVCRAEVGGHDPHELATSALDAMVDAAVRAALLSEEEIAALTETKSPLIRLRGQWVALDTEQLRRGLEFLERKPTGRKTTAEILALAASHPDDVDTPLEVTAVRADGWLGDLLAGAAAASLQPLDPPDGFTATLRPYQQRGLAWLAFLSSLGLGSCLADDMGLGKTVQLLALETLESVQRHQDRGVGPTLLLCPMSLVGNWQQEAARFAPNLRVYAHHGGARLHGEALRDHLERTDLVVSTYTTATRDIDELAEYEWNRVVLDEAQAVKNSLSRAAKAVRRLRAAHRVALTGTPMENRLAELWSIMDFLNPGLLGSSERFRTRYAIPIERHGHTEPAERLRASTRPYILRRLKTDPAIIDDLPEKIEIKQYCQLTTEQASLYQAVVADMMEKIENTEGIERRGNVLAAMAKLKQVCNHPAQLLHDRSPVGRRSGKVIRLEEILEEILAEGDRVLCFTQFTEFAELLVPHLAARFGRAARDIAYLHGGTPRKRRDEMVARFQSGDGPPIFLLSLKAGGTGLNLTAANHVVHLDRWWNPAVENQATDRAFRIGQRRTVQVRKFICTGTLEEKIDEMIEEKKALADLVVTDGEGWLTELSTRDLREVFALSEGAVGE